MTTLLDISSCLLPISHPTTHNPSKPPQNEHRIGKRKVECLNYMGTDIQEIVHIRSRNKRWAASHYAYNSLLYTQLLNFHFFFYNTNLGIQLVPLDERIDKPYSKIFFIFFSMNVNILSYVLFLGFLRLDLFILLSFPLFFFSRFSSGTLGPVIFGLGLRDACLTIILFNLLCCAFPSYM